MEMNVNLFVGLISLGASIIGVVVGIIFGRIFKRWEDKKIYKNLQEVIEGKRKNILIIKGKEYEAKRFVLKDKDDNITVIDLKGGEQDVKRNQKNKEGKIKDQIPDCPPPRKDSRGTRKKKRNSRRGNRTIRRFG